MDYFRKTVAVLHIVFTSLLIPLQGLSVADKVSQVEGVIQQDPGNRGVHNFYTRALFEAAKSLQKANHVAILTGFFIPSAQQPETDGPLGAVFLAESLAALGKQVTIVTDISCLRSVTSCTDLVQNQLIQVTVFPELKEEQEQFVTSLCTQIDCLLSIERVGRTFDGTYRSMRAIDITAKTAPLDDLFIYAAAHPEIGITTIGIGDGGNEIGMGGKVEDVKRYIPRGEEIACIIPADHLIVTGVSNWGGYALAGALWCMVSEEGLSIDQVYPSIEGQFRMLENMILMDCCDGVLGKPVLCVDGLPWSAHQTILEEIRKIIALPLKE